VKGIFMRLMANKENVIFLTAFFIVFCLIVMIFVNNLSQIDSTGVASLTMHQHKAYLRRAIPNPKPEKENIITFPRYSQVKPPPKEAMFYEKLPGGRVKCKLCPWECTLKPGERGICKVRLNEDGKLVTLCYSRPCTIHVDPIEKKPFYHFLPGENALSIATAGCNLGCKYCQNWQISQRAPEGIESLYIPPEGIIRLAKMSKSRIIAFTYSEPVVFFEYMLDIAKLAKENNIKTVVVTGGFINPEPLRLLCKYVDAIKVDLKAFNEKYYKEVVLGKLKPILEAMKVIKAEGIHLEIVYLVVPTLNDDPEEIKEMCKWIKENLGEDIPLHFSRFYPQYKMKNLPPTPLSTLENLRKVALDSGLKYVYIGNVPSHPAESTYCPKDGKLLIRRIGYQVVENNIERGRCKFDGTPIYGVFRWNGKR
jgi:pyruvate formate lyase activating enzyme